MVPFSFVSFLLEVELFRLNGTCLKMNKDIVLFEHFFTFLTYFVSLQNMSNKSE